MKLLPISTLRSMTVEEQDKLAKEVCQLVKTAVDATNAHKSSMPMAGKVVCVFEERLNELKSDRNPDGTTKKRQIASNTSLSSYWESNTGTKLNNHWLSCAVAFGTYVRSELITEADYDKNTAQCLELAASIATAVGGEISHSAVIEAANELKDRSKDSAKNLRELLASVKEPKVISAEKAQAMLATIIQAGFLTTVVIPAVGAEIAHITDLEIGKSAFMGLDTAISMFEQNKDETGARRFTDATLDAWSREISERDMVQQNGGNTPVQLTQAGQPTGKVINAPSAPAPQSPAPASEKKGKRSPAPAALAA